MERLWMRVQGLVWWKMNVYLFLGRSLDQLRAKSENFIFFEIIVITMRSTFKYRKILVLFPNHWMILWFLNILSRSYMLKSEFLFVYLFGIDLFLIFENLITIIFCSITGFLRIKMDGQTLWKRVL